MTLIKGQSVILVCQKEVGADPFGKPIFSSIDITVDNVLIAPTSTQDVINQMSIDGRKAVYTLAIPKEDYNDWENKIVKFFGKDWKTVGVPLQGIDELIPLDWNKKVMVERYE